jgi:hypothetical protein
MSGTWSRACVALALLTSTTPATAQSSRDAEREARRTEQIRERMAQLTPADFQRTVTSQDDDLDTEAVITTEPGFRYRGGFTDRVRTDSFLRAIISKRTGTTVFQVYATITYGGDWRRYRSATYAVAEGPRAAEVLPISEDVKCTYGVCTYFETVGFLVPEAEMRQIAATYRPVNLAPWRFRLRAQSGDTWNEEMSPAEVAGLVAAVDAYRASRGSAQTP